MQRTHAFRNRFLAAAFAVLVVVSAPMPARAASKEIIELQTQVQQLMDNVQRIQSTLDSRFSVLQSLSQQTADDANRITATVTALQTKLAAQTDAMSGKLDTASGQAQALNDSVDELKSRIAKLDKSIQDLQAQLQNIQNPPQMPAPTPAAPAPVAPAPRVPAPRVPAKAEGGETPASGPSAAIAPSDLPAANQAPPLAETFQAGVRDLNAARYDLATGEFQDVIHYYPQDELAGTAHYYLGEISYHQMKLTEAVKAYNAVLEGFPGNTKAPAAQLRKGMALLQMNRRDAGIHELRLLIQRHPQTQEAQQARTKLNAMGVKIVAAPAAH
jgi:tol-pal system protein YbgF